MMPRIGVLRFQFGSRDTLVLRSASAGFSAGRYLLDSSDFSILASGIAASLEESLAGSSEGVRFLAGRTDRLMDGERREVAILFLGISIEDLSPEAAEVYSTHGIGMTIMEFLSSVVESFGGYVDKLEGHRLMALFGARSAAENDCARAAGCGLRMLEVVQEVAALLPDGSRIGAGAGIHFGPVVVAPDPAGHLTATGSAVNIASRIEELAEDGRVLVSEAAAEQCGDLFDFRGLGDFGIRGTSTRVSLFEPAGPGRLRRERWERAARLKEVPVFGREGEKARLCELLSGALVNPAEPVLLRIRGEAGIGKSRLLHYAMSEARDMTVLHGHARHYSQTPFWIWIDMLREYLGISDDTPGMIASKLGSLARSCSDARLGSKVIEEIPRLTGLLSLERKISGTDSPAESRDLAVALRIVLSAIASEGPLILALEDLHWIDEASARVLQLFADSPELRHGAVVAATERPSGRDYGIPEDRWEDVDLEALGTDAIGEIFHYLLFDGEGPVSLDPSLGEFLHEGARGNPFYAEELVLSLHEIGGIHCGGGGRWHLSMNPSDIRVPSSVGSLIQSRVDVLPSEERKVLQLASVIGTDFREKVLETVMAGLGMEEQFARSVGPLSRKGYLIRREGGILSFRHDLLQSSVYRTVLRHNRRIVHGITATAYQELYPDETEMLAPIIFNHWKLAGDRDRTLEWSVKALGSARDSDLGSEMVSIADHVLSLTGDEPPENQWPARAAALKVKHAILARSGDIPGAMELIEKVLEEAGSRGSSSEEAAAIRARCILLNELGRHQEIEGLYQQALAKASEAGDEMLRSRIYSSMANFYSDTGRDDLALEKYRASTEICLEEGDRKYLAALLSNTANLMMRLGRREEAMENYRESIRICREHGMRSSLGYALNGYAILLATENRLEEAGGLFEEALEYQRDIGNRTLESSILNNLGVLTRMMGDYDRSLHFRLSALEMARFSGNQRSVAIALVNLGNIHRLLEDLESALEYIEEAVDLAVRIRDPITVCHAVSIRGMVRLRRNDIPGALADYDEAVGIVESSGLRPGVVDDLDEFRDVMTRMSIEFREPANWEGLGPEQPSPR